MITTVLIEHPWMTTLGLVLLVVAGPLAGLWLVRRRRVAQVLLVVALLVIALLTLVPTGSDLGVRCVAEWSLPTLGQVEPMANVVLFAPAVLLVTILTRRPVVTLLGASSASLLIEAVQAVATPLGRSCSTGDWFANTLGAALGVTLAVVALRLDHRRRTPSPHAGVEPRE